MDFNSILNSIKINLNSDKDNFKCYCDYKNVVEKYQLKECYEDINFKKIIPPELLILNLKEKVNTNNLKLNEIAYDFEIIKKYYYDHFYLTVQDIYIRVVKLTTLALNRIINTVNPDSLCLVITLKEYNGDSRQLYYIVS